MPKPPITDSPWLWFTLFTAVGLTTLLVTGGKFGKRQSNIDNKDRARVAVAEGLHVAIDAQGKKQATKVPKYTSPEEVRIRLVPLATVLAVLCAGSLGMLVRERLFHHTGTTITEEK